MVDEGEISVCSDFGSSASELATCQRGVGIGDRHELIALELRGEPARLGSAFEQAVGVPLASLHAVEADGAWWCPVAPDRVLALCEPPERPAVTAILDEIAAVVEGISWSDVSADYEALAIVGPGSGRLLEGASAGESDGLPDGGCRGVHLAAGLATLIHQAPTQFLALVPRSQAVSAWRALAAAGDGLGLGYVGRHALDAFAISARTQARQARG